MVVALGEVLWDEFGVDARLGGAPANFAVHCAALGASSTLLSAVGNDERGLSACRQLAARGVDVSGVAIVPTAPTGRVVVATSGAVARYDIVTGVAWDAIPWDGAFPTLAREADVVYFGTLAQRGAVSRATLHRFLDHVPQHVLRVLDLNLRPPFHDQKTVQYSLEHADFLKLSGVELNPLARHTGLSGDAETLCHRLRERFGLELVVVTLGDAGCRVYSHEGCHEVPAEPAAVLDPVGAGDAFTAAFVVHYMRGDSLPACAEEANRLGAWVVTQPGATPPLPVKMKVF